MGRKGTIIKSIKNLKFFDSTLKVIPEKIVSLKTTLDIKGEKRLYTELKLVRKILTVHTYFQCAESYDIVDNPTQVITKVQFKKGITSSIAKTYKDGIITIGGINAQYMDEEEFSLMKEIYWDLKQPKKCI